MASEQGAGSNSKRERGVQASPAKLRAAMLAAGIKSQIEVAKRIQDAEDLDKLPRTLVNRVFRGEAVDPVSIERVARALDTDAWTLYLSTQEDQSADTLPQPVLDNVTNILPVSSAAMQVGSAQTSRRFWLWVMLLTLVIVLLLINLIWQGGNPRKLLPTFTAHSFVTPSVLIRFENPELDRLVAELEEQLKADFNVAVLAPKPDDLSALALDLAREYQSDVVISVDGKQYGRYIRLRVMTYYQGNDSISLYKVLSRPDVNQQADSLATELEQKISEYIFVGSTALMPSDSQIRAWDHYLQARQLMDENKIENWSGSEKIINLLFSALQLYPQFAVAEAALCETYMWYSLEGHEKQRLEHAASHCQKALQLDAGNSYVMSSAALLQRRLYGAAKGVEEFNKVLDVWPDNLDALQGLGASYLLAFNDTSSDMVGVAKRAEQVLNKVREIEPDYWYNHYQLGAHYFYQGQMEQSLELFQYAADLGEQAIAYNGLGAVAYCLNHLQQAKMAFEKLLVLHPDSHLAEEQLGMIAFFRQDYQQSLALRLSALQKMGDPDQIGYHQVWASIAASYAALGSNTEAIDAYENALRIIKRDRLRNNLTVWAEIGEILYQQKINRLQGLPVDVSDAQRTRLLDLATQKLEPGAIVALASLLQELNHIEPSEQLWQQAITICPIYQNLKDITAAQQG